MVGQTERRKLSDLVASRIREFILTHHLQAGDRLPTELELAKQFGVSRVSIREATKALCFLGFLEATPRRGTTVSRVDLRRISQFLELHPSLRNASTQQLIDARIVLESGVLPYLLARMRQDPTVYDSLRAAVAHEAEVDDPLDLVELDRQFHTRLMEASGVTPLFLFHEVLLVFFGRIEDHLLKSSGTTAWLESWPQQVKSHQALIDALRDGDLELAQRHLAGHIHEQQPWVEEKV